MPALRDVLRHCRTGVDGFRNLIGWHESEEKITRDAQAYWDAPPEDRKHLFAHWREGFADPQTWLAVGRESFDLFTDFARSTKLPIPLKRVVEWGSGGGANAVHFATVADEFYAVDITQESLDECGRQMASVGLQNFRPVLVQAASPETALQEVPADCDLFLCVYVFELLPTPEYGLKILKLASQMLRAGGMALVHIKYTTGLTTKSRRWGYRFGVANMTTYGLEEFWEASKVCGFKPHAISLVPKQPLVNEERYAYFILVKN